MFCSKCGKSTRLGNELCPKCDYNNNAILESAKKLEESLEETPLVEEGSLEDASIVDEAPLEETSVEESPLDELPLEEIPLEEDLPDGALDEAPLEDEIKTVSYGDIVELVSPESLERPADKEELYVEEPAQVEEPDYVEEPVHIEEQVHVEEPAYVEDPVHVGDYSDDETDHLEDSVYVEEPSQVTSSIDIQNILHAGRVKGAEKVKDIDTSFEARKLADEMDSKDSEEPVEKVRFIERVLDVKDAISDNKGRLILPLAAILVIVLVIIAISSFGGRGAGEISQEGFDTPEDAVVHYIEGLRNSDFDQMISAFAIDIYVEHYDFAAKIEMLQMYYPTMELIMPNSNEFVTALNVENRRMNVTRSIIQQYIVLSQVGFDMAGMEMVEDPTDFVYQLDGNLTGLDFETIEIIGFISPEDVSATYVSPENQSNIETWTAHLGIDERVTVVLVFQIEGEDYILFADVGSYDGRWFILQFGGNLTNLRGLPRELQGTLTPELADILLQEVGTVGDGQNRDNEDDQDDDGQEDDQDDDLEE